VNPLRNPISFWGLLYFLNFPDGCITWDGFWLWPNVKLINMENEGNHGEYLICWVTLVCWTYLCCSNFWINVICLPSLAEFGEEASPHLQGYGIKTLWISFQVHWLDEFYFQFHEDSLIVSEFSVGSVYVSIGVEDLTITRPIGCWGGHRPGCLNFQDIAEKKKKIFQNKSPKAIRISWHCICILFILYYTIYFYLYCIIRYYLILYYIAFLICLYYIICYYAILYCIAFYYIIILHIFILYEIILYYNRHTLSYLAGALDIVFQTLKPGSF